MGLDIMYGERERSYLLLFRGRCGMGYSYRSGSLWSGLEWRQPVQNLRLPLNITGPLEVGGREGGGGGNGLSRPPIHVSISLLNNW